MMLLESIFNRLMIKLHYRIKTRDYLQGSLTCIKGTQYKQAFPIVWNKSGTSIDHSVLFYKDVDELPEKAQAPVDEFYAYDISLSRWVVKALAGLIMYHTSFSSDEETKQKVIELLSSLTI